MTNIGRLDNRDIQLINQRYAAYMAAADKDHQLAIQWMLVRRGLLTAALITMACVPSFWWNRTNKLWRHSQILQDPENAVLLDTINPNSAPWYSLAMLPAIGPARAHAIVAYRRNIITNNQQGQTFGSPQDLDNVPSIGPSTIEACQPYLSFDP